MSVRRELTDDLVALVRPYVDDWHPDVDEELRVAIDEVVVKHLTTLEQEFRRVRDHEVHAFKDRVARDLYARPPQL